MSVTWATPGRVLTQDETRRPYPTGSVFPGDQTGSRDLGAKANLYGRSFLDRVVVVTGASAGVGRAVSRAFGEQRAKVALLARGTDGLKAARREIEAAGGEALDIPTDVSDHDQVERAAQLTEDELGPIDLWVNDAMLSVFKEFVEIEPTDFARVTEVTYLGYVNGTRAALKRMLPRDRGKVVQVGSALAYRGIPMQSAYCGAKHAIQGFTDSVRSELLHRKSGVEITEVHLPALNTPQFHWVKTDFKQHPQPVPPIYQPEIAARAVVWAADHERRHLHVGLPTALTIWADKFIPGVLDRYLAKTGIESQQAPWPTEPGRPDNLYHPVEGDQGAHGEFGTQAHERSPHLWVTTHRGVIGTIAGALVAVAAGVRARAR